MDPNAALATARSATNIVLTDDDAPAPAAALAEAFDALDAWLTSGGFLPTEWSAR